MWAEETGSKQVLSIRRRPIVRHWYFNGPHPSHFPFPSSFCFHPSAFLRRRLEFIESASNVSDSPFGPFDDHRLQNNCSRIFFPEIFGPIKIVGIEIETTLFYFCWVFDRFSKKEFFWWRCFKQFGSRMSEAVAAASDWTWNSAPSKYIEFLFPTPTTKSK